MVPIITPGSPFYYSVRFITAEKRPVLAALYAFHQEIRRTTYHYHDRFAARAKLNWWREELKRLAQQQAQHPITQQLSAYKMPISLMQTLIDGYEMDLDITDYPSFRELHLYCIKTGGSFLESMSFILGFTAPETPMFAKHLGISLKLIDLVNHRNHDKLRGIQYFADEDRGAIIQQAKNYYSLALNQLVPDDRLSQAPLLIQGEINHRILIELEHQPYKQAIALTPLHMLWIAWKINRHVKVKR